MYRPPEPVPERVATSATIPAAAPGATASVPPEISGIQPGVRRWAMATQGASGRRDAKEYAVSRDQLKRKETVTERGGETATLLDEERPLDAWSRCAPIRLAGYEDDLSETHILRSID